MRAERYAGSIAALISAAVVVWLLYVAVKVAQHVDAWPF